MGNNKFQWGRVDEIIMFIVALLFLVLMAYLSMPQAAIMAMAGSLITIVPIYIKSALERHNGNGDSNGNGNGNGNKPLPLTILPSITTDVPPVSPTKPLNHHLRDEG